MVTSDLPVNNKAAGHYWVVHSVLQSINGHIAWEMEAFTSLVNVLHAPAISV